MSLVLPATPVTQVNRDKGTSSKRESQWSVSPEHAERRALGLVPDSLTPEQEISEKLTQVVQAHQKERKLSAPTVTFGGSSSGTSSSKSIAKLILEGMKTSLPSRKTSKEEKADYEGLGRKLSDIENKVVPLTFRRNSSSSSESQDSDNNTEIPAKTEIKETKVEAPEKVRSSPASSLSFSLSSSLSSSPTSSPASRSALAEKKVKNIEDKYELHRAVPYRDQHERKFSTGNSASSSKSIAKMIMSKKKNSVDEGQKYGAKKSEAFSKPCNDKKVSFENGNNCKVSPNNLEDIEQTSPIDRPKGKVCNAWFV